MIIALDLETTWLDKQNDKIIEVALIKIDENTFEILETYSTLINPEIEIPEIISNITNIFDKDVKNAPKIEEVKVEIRDFIWEYPILWHNTTFDRDFLINKGINIEKNVCLDTFLLANFLVSEWKSLNLEYVCSLLKIKLTWAHRALNDTEATVKLFKKLINKLKKLPNNKKEILKYIISKTTDNSWKFINDKYLDKDINKIKKDIFIKKILKIVWKWEKIEDEDEKVEIKESNFKEVLSNIWNLEIRENQVKMSKLVDKALKKSWKIAIEAPTWIWKTFAYLLPSIFFSKNMWEQIYVSTSTKVLQDQIFFKDLDFLSKNLDIDFSYAKLKWKSNYLWILSFLEFIFLEEQIWEKKISFILKIIFWLFRTEHWELDELNYYWEEFGYLKDINANNPYTFSRENDFELYEYALKARRFARKADIVVINNNILFQDIALEWVILWDVKNLILDEAHGLEDVITNSLKKDFCLNDLEKNFSKIWKILKKYKQNPTSISYIEEKLIFNINTLFSLLENYISTKVSQESIYKRILISEDFFKENNLIDGLISNIESNIMEIFDFFDTLTEENKIALSKEKMFLEEILEILNITTKNKDKEKYIPIVSSSEKKWISLEYTLLKPWDFLKKNLWDKMESVILASATLKTGENFDYIKHIISLEDFDFYELQTDFDYKKQALLFMPNDIWSIKNNMVKIIEFLWDFFKIAKWRTLVLFTAFFMIKECYTRLNISLKKENINLLAQSIWWWKYKQISFFKENPQNSILIWTDTFWEWVDIPWEDLKYLIIHKIPFMVPSDPIFIARSRLFKDSFKDYSIPKSIIKLKQWFGRLIRSKKDTWIVIFLDDRINSTLWGNAFYKAFPDDINVKISDSKKFLNVFHI